jgi:hypothetical protein
MARPVSLLRDVFTEALETGDPVARAAFLEFACEGNMVLRQHVERLLHADANAGNFFREHEHPPRSLVFPRFTLFARHRWLHSLALQGPTPSHRAMDWPGFDNLNCNGLLWHGAPGSCCPKFLRRDYHWLASSSSRKCLYVCTSAHPATTLRLTRLP